MLRSRGFDVVAASNGDAALAAILSDGADGLVSDFQMPDLNGLTLSRVLRGLREYAVLPMVVFTGLGEADPRLIPLRAIPNFASCTTTATGFGVGTARARAHVASATAVA
jgi:CheY-like chemotaxis protein